MHGCPVMRLICAREDDCGWKHTHALAPPRMQDAAALAPRLQLDGATWSGVSGYGRPPSSGKPAWAYVHCQFPLFQAATVNEVKETGHGRGNRYTR